MTETEATLIAVAREAAFAQGWNLDDCIYSVRADGSGWIVQVDRAPGYQGNGEPSVVIDGTFFVYVDSNGKPMRILSHAEDIDLTKPAAGSRSP